MARFSSLRWIPLAAALLWPSPSPAPLSLDDYDPDAREELVLQLVVGRRVLDDALLAIREGDAVFYPLGYLGERLGVALEVDTEAGRVSGWIAEPEQIVEFDAATGAGRLGEEALQFSEGRYLWEREDLYFDAAALAALLPLEITYRPRDQKAELVPTGPLPIFQRWEREARWDGLREAPHRRAVQPLDPLPYRGWSRPGWAVAVDHRHPSREDLPARTDGELRMAGDVLYHEGRLYASTVDDELRRADLTLARDYRHRWLTRHELGHVAAPSAPMVTRHRSGLGGAVTNAPYGRPAAGLDGFVVEGDAPDGWSAELYRNGELVDYIVEITDGRYRFDDVPVAAGENRYDIMLYGPRGQVRTERRTAYAGPGMVPPGEIRYDLRWYEPSNSLVGDYRSVLDVEDGQRLQARFNAGLHQRLTAGVDLHQSDGVADHPDRAAGVDLTGTVGLTWWQLRRAVDMEEEGAATRMELLRPIHRWTARAMVTEVEELATEDLGVDLDRRTEWSLSGPVFHWFRWRSDYRRDDLVDARVNHRLRLYQTGRIGGVRLGHRWERVWGDTGFGHRTDGSLDAGIHGPRDRYGFGLRYTAAPEREVELVRASWNRLLNSRLATRVEARAGLSERIPDALGAGLTASYRRVRFGLGGTVEEDGEWLVTAGLETGGLPDPFGGGWRLTGDGRRHLGDGAAAVRVMLMDGEDEVPLEGVDVRAGGRVGQTGEDGVALLSGLDPYRRHDVLLELGVIEDPFIRQVSDEVSIEPRPGAVQAVEYRLALTGEIEGTVWRVVDGRREPVPAVRVVALNGDGVAAVTTTAYDGFYILDRLLPGEYTVALHEEDARRLGVEPRAGGMAVRIERGGDILYGTDILL